jgi:hypothetical protein
MTKEELKQKAVEGWDLFEGKSPHKPFIDEVKKTAKYLVTPRTYRDGTRKPSGGV